MVVALLLAPALFGSKSCLNGSRGEEQDNSVAAAAAVTADGSEGRLLEDVRLIAISNSTSKNWSDEEHDAVLRLRILKCPHHVLMKFAAMTICFNHLPF